jgi:hypothetical protein
MGSPTKFPHGVSSQGVPVLGGQGIMSNGKAYFVDPTNGSDSNDGKTAKTAKATIAAGEDLLVANQNDVLYYFASSTGPTLSSTLTWDKDYTHFIGICAPTMIGQRCRIFQLSTATGVSPLINITANGCSFKNLYIFHGVADATSKINVQVTGDRNYFENIHFAGIGNDTMDVADARSLFLNAAHENRFVNCVIGLDTIDAGSAANAELEFDSESSRNVFDDCVFQRRIEHNTNHPLVKLTDNYGIGSFTLFRNSIFVYTSVNAVYHGTEVFQIPAIASPTRKIILMNCVAVSGNASAISWDSNSRGITFANMVAAAATAAGGLATVR